MERGAAHGATLAHLVRKKTVMKEMAARPSTFSRSLQTHAHAVPVACWSGRWRS